MLQITWSATTGNVCLLIPIVRPILVLLVLNASPNTALLVERVFKMKEDVSTTQQANVPVLEITSLVVMVSVLSWDVARMIIMIAALPASPLSLSIVLQDTAISLSVRLIPRLVARPVPQGIVSSTEFASKLMYTVHHITTTVYALLARLDSS